MIWEFFDDEVQKVLRVVEERGEITYGELCLMPVHDPVEVVAKLLSAGLVGLKARESGGKRVVRLERVKIRDPYKIEDIPGIPDIFKKEWRDMFEAKIHERLWIPSHAVVYSLSKRKKGGKKGRR